MYAFDSVCMKCWQTLQHFNRYCDKIRSIHRDLVDESSLVQIQSKCDDDQTEVFMESVENIEEFDLTEQECEDTVAVFAIETDAAEDASDTTSRRNTS